jgi:hypothetical protein
MPKAAVVRCRRHNDRWERRQTRRPREGITPNFFTLAGQKLLSHVFFLGATCYIRFLLIGGRNGQNKSQFNVSRGPFKTAR